MSEEEKTSEKKEKFYRVGELLHWWESAYNNANSLNLYSADGSSVRDALECNVKPSRSIASLY